MGSHVELHWSEPNYARFMKRLAGLGRLIAFDKRGTGRSDRVTGVPTLEERMEDLGAVLDAANSRRAIIVGISEGAAMASLFAATYPARALGLILCSSFPTGSAQGGYLGAVRPEQMEQALEIWDSWGSGRSYEIYAPSLAAGGLHRWFMGLFERAAASRKMMKELVQALFKIDIRHVLPLIQSPALMFHRIDEIAPIESAREMARLMPNCRLVELEGNDHVPFAGHGAAQIMEDIEGFVSEVRSERVDRALSTVMFTDIVGSTERAVDLGDRRWLQLLDRHNEIVRRSLQTHGGHELTNPGDAFVAHFDGPVKAVRAASGIAEAVKELDLHVRIGIHTGEVQIANGGVGGLALHVGARVAAAAKGDEVLASAAVRDLVAGSGVRFIDRGERELKGLPGRWSLFAVDRATALDDQRASEPEAWTDDLSILDRSLVAYARHFPATVRPVMRLVQGDVAVG
jgi:class 3 adenylate cyclase